MKKDDRYDKARIEYVDILELMAKSKREVKD